MNIMEIRGNLDHSLKYMLAEADFLKVDILSYSAVFEGERGAVIVLRGENTIAYKQALEAKKQLLDEDVDLLDDF